MADLVLPETRRRAPAATAPARMAPLAKLPIFLELAGKPVVIAGGSEAAAWKAELMAAAGAEVRIHAAEPATEMRRLAARPLATGTIRLIEQALEEADLAGVAVAIADLPDAAEAGAFAAAARKAGALVNVIDNPDFCDFQFGAIVNRSPVVVGISTDGAAPILGQAIRRRIEAVLPAGLGGWAAAARAMRDRVAALWPKLADRRAFWERFVDLAFTRKPGADAVAVLERTVDDALAERATGRVTLVGAGPGDAEHLTLKAVRALQSADVVLFDDLVEPEVLELARREAEHVHVGKRGHGPACAQGDINTWLVDLAQAGKRVVRLKSGDPMIFGRAGEELAALDAAGIPVEIVPGVTAGLALASALGISLTHRDLAHSVRFVTGHGRNGRLPDDLDWQGLADPETTLVVYMGGRTAPRLAARLIAHGLAPTTPVVIAARLAKAEERHWSGTLESLTRDDDALGAESPIILGIGQVFGTHPTLDMAPKTLSSAVLA
jgi:uroporphyrin-III C-methyltransferase/precorrin-2 dehydrogenase/sirohydrochlorin ferrochelatase